MTRWLPLLLALTACSGGAAGPECTTYVQAWQDTDGDGYGVGAATAVCKVGPGQADRPFDCDDDDSGRHPGVPEACNGVDDDCDGEIDDGLNNRVFHQDADGDGFGALFPAQLACEATEGWVRNSDDCDDSDPTRHPEAPEICNAGVDDNCNGVADELDPTLNKSSLIRYFEDQDADGFGAYGGLHVDRCAPVPSFVDNAQDCNDRDPETNPTAQEVCDMADNDCDGLVDMADPDLTGTCPSLFTLGSGADSTYSGTGYLRGHVFRATDTTLIESFGLDLGLTSACDLVFYMQESTNPEGPWTTLFNEELTVPAGFGYQYSPYVGIEMVPGQFYHLGVGWSCSAEYYSDNGNISGQTPIGQLVGRTLHNTYPGVNANYQPDTYGDKSYVYLSAFSYTP